MAPRRPAGADAFPKEYGRAFRHPPGRQTLYAALDLGTNSCRMLIARPQGSQFPGGRQLLEAGPAWTRP